MTKRNFHFFRLEDRVLLSAEGIEAVEAIAPDAEVTQELHAEVDALGVENDAIEAAAGEATASQEVTS